MMNFNKKLISSVLVGLFVLSMNTSLMAFGATTGVPPTSASSAATNPVGVQDNAVNPVVPNQPSSTGVNSTGISTQPNPNSNLNNSSNPQFGTSSVGNHSIDSRTDQNNMYNQMIKGQ